MFGLSVDIETFSSVDIKKAGAYKYALSPDFEILLIAYAWGGDPVQLLDLKNMSPNDVISLDTLCKALKDPNVTKHAYNAAFEWWCFTCAGYETPVSSWRCTMAQGLYCGYPAGLGKACEALGLPQDKRKLGIGMPLINTFCKPVKPTAANGNRTRTLPHHEPERWGLLKNYCKQDVEAERAIQHVLAPFPLPEKEQRLWELDCLTNARGVPVDKALVEGAIWCGEQEQERLLDEAKRISGLDNPKSRSQLLKWIQEELDEEDIQDIRKDTVTDLLAKDLPSDDARRLLELRQQFGKTSTSKYAAMRAACCGDGRIRGVTQYYGANRTGRYAGRLIQLQNLPQNHLDALDLARQLTIDKKLDTLRSLYGSVPSALSQLIRTALIPSPGRVLVVADFSSIEARIIAWLAGEQWVLDVFATHGKIYEMTAAQMFNIPLESIKKGNPEYEYRAKGKVAVLACGYQGSVGALIKMGALRSGLTEEELPDIVARWRQANPNIVRLWHEVEDAALETVRTGRATAVKCLRFEILCDADQVFFTIVLPSGRRLFYPGPFIAPGSFGKPALHYHGIDGAKRWGVEATYGGKIVENCIQGIARDCLAETLLHAQEGGYETLFHVHDELIVDGAENDLEPILTIMAQPIEWAPGLLLRGAGGVMTYYQKD